MDYRFLPESAFWDGMCEDVKDMERWLRGGGLEGVLRGKGEAVEINGGRIVVSGASAGAHLALLTVSPACISNQVNKRKKGED
jgi:acetyl esterase/lipase